MTIYNNETNSKSELFQHDFNLYTVLYVKKHNELSKKFVGFYGASVFEKIPKMPVYFSSQTYA